MSDPPAIVPQLTVISTSGRFGAGRPTTTDDDLAMARLASWLAEVSAEATLSRAARDEDLPRTDTAS